MNSSARKVIVVSALLFAVAAAVLAFLLREQEETGADLMSFSENVETWDGLNRANTALNDGESDDTTPRQQLHSLVLQSESDTVTFLAYVDELGKKVGVTVNASELKSQKTSESGFDKIAATFSLRGSEPNVTAMVELLELLPYDSHIESLTLTRQDGMAEAVLQVLVSVLE